MKAAKKILSLALAACMAFLLLPLSALADSPPVCSIDKGEGDELYYDFSAALEYALASSTDTPTTIKLLDDIDHKGGIKVENKTVTFDLNGFYLDVNNAAGNGLEVGEGGVVNFTGGDEDHGFYVTGTGFFNNYGVYAHDGGRATVSYAEGPTGAYAKSGGKVAVYDGIWGHVAGAAASGGGSDVTVHGGVYIEEDDPGSFAVGILVGDGATATIEEEVEIAANNATGVICSGGTVTLDGDLWVYGEDAAMGVVVEDPEDSTYAKVYLNGMVDVWDSEGEVMPYISWGDSSPLGEGVLEGDYLLYTSPAEHGMVYVKGACMIGTIAYFTLDEALADAATGASTTIKLLRNIDYYKSLVVVGKTITFDLSGHELNVMASGEGKHGLEVGAGGVVDITGDTGEGYSALDVNSEKGYGVYACDGGQATVTIARGHQAAVYAENKSVVYVKEWAVSSKDGVLASGGSMVTVDGDGSYSEGKRISIGDGGSYIKLQGVAKTDADGVPGEAPYENYLVYSDESNTVRVKTDAVCKLSIVTPSDGTYTSLHNTLGKALDTVTSSIAGSKATITLFADIEHPHGIEVYSKTITFNLGGFTLNVTSDDDHGLYVNGSNSVVDIVGGGEFNVKSTAPGRCGVLAVNGGQATVTNAVSIGGTGVGTDSGEGNKVVVMGNVTGANGIGVTEDSEVIVHGNVTATDANGTGVSASGGGLAVIDGTITVQSDGVYIELFNGEDFLPLDPDNSVPMTTGTYAGYLRYTEGTNYVYVKVFKNAALNPATAAFNKNPTKQADVTATVTWNGASSITAVKAGDTPLISPADYSVNRGTLTINKAYLATKPVGSLVLTVVFDKGAPATLTITVSNTGSGGAVPGGGDGPIYGEHTLNDAATGVTVSGGGIHDQARLTVTPVGAQSLPDALKQAAAKGALLLGFEVTLSGGFRGGLTISFPVGAQYNGQTVTVLHYVNGRVEVHTAVVADGRATITVTSLSPFAVVLPAATVKVPNTGGAAAAYGFALIFLAALMAGYAVRKKHEA